MKRRMVYSLAVAVALAVGFAVTASAGPDFWMRCESLWPFC